MKKIQFLTIAFALLIITAISCKKAEEAPAPAEPAKAAFDLATAKTTVEAGYAEFEKAFNSKDSVGLANCYATDAKFMAPNDKAVEGRPAIQKSFTEWFKGDTPQIKISLVELWGNDTNLTAENSWSMTGKDGKVIDEGKSIEVYKMEDGKWKLLRDCWNSNMPAVPIKK
ncbi:MAG TPA: nuclear transport factor 2 family protein [Flavobacterium sp.]|uniref:YybH family protein n=1 Tax=Flavobacterium sp. TaxID=239 RepID=UPI002CC8FC9D|nr:nuclear transport factor 2 family protein [Flavobacterium sp.]HNP33503.1 nuclear transport factor 2 family protein [Flavobacterium sp.]